MTRGRCEAGIAGQSVIDHADSRDETLSRPNVCSYPPTPVCLGLVVCLMFAGLHSFLSGQIGALIVTWSGSVYPNPGDEKTSLASSETVRAMAVLCFLSWLVVFAQASALAPVLVASAQFSCRDPDRDRNHHRAPPTLVPSLTLLSLRRHRAPVRPRLQCAEAPPEGGRDSTGYATQG